MPQVYWEYLPQEGMYNVWYGRLLYAVASTKEDANRAAEEALEWS